MARESHTAALRAAINDEIVTLRRQLQQDQRGALGESSQPRRGSGRQPASATSPSSAAATEIIEALGQRIERLEQVCDWMDDDPELRTLIDRVIGNQIAAALERQRIFNIGLNIALLMAGWMLSLLGTPANLAHLLGRG